MSEHLVLQLLKQDTDQYIFDLKQFFEGNNLRELFHPPVDHLAVKLGDKDDYERYIEEILPFCETLSYTEMNNRRLATAKLLEPILVGNLGETAYLEIMEPRPEKVGKDFAGFEHIEIYHPNFDQIQTILSAQNMPYEIRENAYHKAVVVRINNLGQEIKFTNSRLGEIVKAQIEKGESKVIK